MSRARKAVADSHTTALAAEMSRAGAVLLRAWGDVMGDSSPGSRVPVRRRWRPSGLTVTVARPFWILTRFLRPPDYIAHPKQRIQQMGPRTTKALGIFSFRGLLR